MDGCSKWLKIWCAKQNGSLFSVSGKGAPVNVFSGRGAGELMIGLTWLHLLLTPNLASLKMLCSHRDLDLEQAMGSEANEFPQRQNLCAGILSVIYSIVSVVRCCIEWERGNMELWRLWTKCRECICPLVTLFSRQRQKRKRRKTLQRLNFGGIVSGLCAVDSQLPIWGYVTGFSIQFLIA